MRIMRGVSQVSWSSGNGFLLSHSVLAYRLQTTNLAIGHSLIGE